MKTLAPHQYDDTSSKSITLGTTAETVRTPASRFLKSKSWTKKKEGSEWTKPSKTSKKKKKKVSTCESLSSEKWYSYDGMCNNVLHPERGKSQSFFSRGYEGYQHREPEELLRFNPRNISNHLGSQPINANPALDENESTMVSILFGQFVNHDLEKNSFQNEFDLVFDFIPIDPNDPICFFPVGGGPPSSDNLCPDSPTIGFRPSDGEYIDGRFEVRNEATSYLDLDTVYGRNKNVANILREGEGGRLKVESYSGTAFGFVPFVFHNMPPSRNSTGLNTDTLNMRQPDDQMPTAGDRRIGDNVSLFLFHTLFLREHNRIAAAISQSHPEISDETVYKQARRINIAQYQNIIFSEYLQGLFGPQYDALLGPYQGYKEDVDPTTSTLFASVAYRFGHSGLASYAPLDICGDISTLVLPPFLPPGSDLPSIGKFMNCYNQHIS